MSDAETPLRIYHNPRCSKSRAAHALLEGQGRPLEVIDYLKTPPTREELKVLLAQLGMKPEALVRRGEAVFKEKYAGRTLNDDQWLDALAADPILIERPIVVANGRAVVARPAELLLDLL